jgi:hypothetical protein
MSLLKKSKPASCSIGCVMTKWTLAVLLFVAAIAAGIGVYNTHIFTAAEGGRIIVQFGSGNSSLAIIAFCIAAVCWSKQMRRCMGKCEVCSVK